MSKLKFDKWENPDGTENYKCRAWVTFNGEGVVSIMASGNIDSITDVSLGNYDINFSAEMPDANYVINSEALNIGLTSVAFGGTLISINPPTINGFRVTYQAMGVVSGYSGQKRDIPHAMVSVFR